VAEKKYIPLQIKKLGSWNPDADIGSMPEDQFSEVRNLRQTSLGDYKIRSGYDDTATFTNGALTDDAEILCSCEYRFTGDDNTVTLFEVVAVFDANNIKLFAINRAPIPATTYWLTQFNRNVLRNFDDSATLTIPYVPTVEPVRAFMVQYGSYIALTVYGLGVYAIYPTSNDPDMWTVRSLGKDRADIPNAFPTFADEYNGDLFIVLNDDTITDTPGGGTLGIRFTHDLTPKKLLAGQLAESIFPPVQYIRVPLNAKYYNSKQTAAFDSGVVPGTTTGLRYWEFSDKDPAISNQDSRSNTHLQTRAWGYRFVFVHKFIDGRGNTITYRSAPSTDIWVPNMIYCPPQVWSKNTGSVNVIGKRPARYLSGLTWTEPALDILPTSADGPVFVFSNEYETQGSADFQTVPFPSAVALQELGEAIIAYNAQSYAYKNSASAGVKWSAGPTNIDENTFLAAMYWAGFWRLWGDLPSSFGLSEQINFTGDIKTPYFCEVPANELASAPLTKFSWSMFASIPSDVTEIEIYRTAFNESDLTVTDDGIDQPLYQTHLYGYCGSLKPDEDFIDDVEDEELDFGNTPDNNDGLLSSNFSGAVIQEYNRHLALGDIETIYQLFGPWPEYQAYIWGVGAGNRSEFIPWGGTDYFAIQYVDADGTLSEIVQLDNLGFTTDTAGDTTWGNVAAVIPAGYMPFITGIRFIYYDGTDFRLVKTVKPDDGYIIATRAECLAGTVITGIGALTPEEGSGPISTKEPGAIVWTEAADIFTIAPPNRLLVHPSSTVTAMHSILGELFVWSQSSTALTNLNGRFEELNKEVGCIGRFCISKLDKIVFFLSASGLYFAESSGVVPFPGYVDSFVRGYLNEQISGIPLLQNGMRSALGYLTKFKELWLYLPGSDDLGGTLRARLIVYKFFGDLYSEGIAAIGKGFVNYELELLNTGNPSYPSGVDDGSQTMVQPLIFTQHSDGSLYAEFKDDTTHLVHSVDNDRQTTFGGNWALEKPCAAGDPLLVKILRAVRHSGNVVGDVFISVGAPRPDGIPDYDTGLVWASVDEYLYSVTADGINEAFNHRIPWAEIAQSTHQVPIVRWRGVPNGDGQQDVGFSGITVFLEALHTHPD
jgi:hypothetical protein